MINSANSSDPIPTLGNTECPPPANGQAGLPAITATAIAGPLRSSITLSATASQVAEARRSVASVVADPTLASDAVRPVPASLLSAA
jgi:hypothetical protein